MTHLVGIGGIGMSAIARLLLASGEQVSGSDVGRTALIDRLEAEGAKIAIGHRAENVDGAARVVVSSAVDARNPEIERARALGIPVVKRGEMLAELAAGKKTIAVAGTHGKTTTTAMVAAVLEAAGLDATVAIGGEPIGTGTNARLGRGEWFVTESDESDGSFLCLNPALAIVTNVENDHVADEAGFRALLGAFERFVAKIPADGLLVAGAGDPKAAALARSAAVGTLTYAVRAPADLTAAAPRFADFGSVFEIRLRGRSIGTLQLSVPGEINVENALAAAAAGLQLGIAFETIGGALRRFRGVRRRFEFLLRTPELTVVDDYAHHPTAVRATIAAARRYHEGPIVVAFEPHRYTRTQYLAAEFARALSGVDRVILAPVYAASETPIPGVEARSIGEPLAALGTAVDYADDVAEIPERVRACAPEGALVLVLGAGAISASAHRLAERGARKEVPLS
jgi:UDP-N-acetylmuramate--alanine ligase